MRLLLDTHALLWLAHEPAKLSKRLVAAVNDDGHEFWVSAVSAMEIATKRRAGRLQYQTLLATDFVREVDSQGFKPLAITCAHAERAGNLDSLHKDPWDRLLAAQAQIEGLTLATVDPFFGEVGVATFW
ncbi:MAG: type II toxin-antitoxin system VapC family toxin [Novosphingobium sp.]|nr:type II toxin-antitoxin system VapC family toxin [Novosphingobium sp.]